MSIGGINSRKYRVGLGATARAGVQSRMRRYKNSMVFVRQAMIACAMILSMITPVLSTNNVAAAVGANVLATDELDSYTPGNRIGAVQQNDVIIQPVIAGYDYYRYIYKDSADSSYAISGLQQSSELIGSNYTAVDIDGDSLDDIIVNQGDRVVILYADGRKVETPAFNIDWNCNTTPGLADSRSSIDDSYAVVGDVNQDGKAEILLNDKCNKLYIFNEDGKLLGGGPFRVSSPTGSTSPDEVNMLGSPVLGDFNGDHKTDFATLTLYKDVAQNKLRYFVDAYQGNGNRLWRHEVTNAAGQLAPFDAQDVARLAVGDIDGDGNMEIVYSVNGKTGALSTTGSQKWEQNVWGIDVILSDLNGDGRLDVATKSPEGGWPSTTLTISALDGIAGSMLTGFPKSIPNTNSRGLFLAFSVKKNQAGNDLVVPTKYGIIVIDGGDGSTLLTIRPDSTCGDLLVTTMDGVNIAFYAACAIQPTDWDNKYYTTLYSLTDDGQPITVDDQNSSAIIAPGFNTNRDNSFYPVKPRDADGGYRLVASDGGIFPFGLSGGFGSTGNIKLWQPIVGMSSTPSNNGYWLVAADGGIFPFGDAVGYGSTGGIKLWQPIVGMAKTPTGNGYWLVAKDGGIFPFGDAKGFGSTGNIKLRQPIVGMQPTPSGNGYWLVASDGGIFPFGDAVGYGSTGNIRLNKPIVGMAATKTGHGYWLVASDGGIFPFGDAVGYGSAGNINLWKPIVGMKTTPTGNGYTLVASDGGIFTYGDAKYYGSTGGINLWKPIVGVVD